MTAEQLEELRKLAALPPDSPTAKVMASLARRVIAAERLVDALEKLPLGDGHLAQLVTAYREASK